MINYSDDYINMMMREYVKVTMNGGNGYDGFRAMLTKHEEEQAIVWETTCPNCRRLLDELHRKDQLDEPGPAVLD